ISDVVDDRLLDYCRRQRRVGDCVDADSLSWLQRWGIVGEAVRLRDGHLYRGETVLDNDLTRPATRAALLAETWGQRLRGGHVLHGGFFLGPRRFYQRLRELPEELAALLCMTGVERTNQLLGDVPLYSAQRRAARFINTGMKVTLSGAVCSDALEDATVVSGVGGQYNFVAMAQDLPGARSVLCIRSTRGSGRQLQSNIVARYGHTTIPRHLRDVVVTEYGIADLRGQSDREVACRLIHIADSRFQGALLRQAVVSGKVEESYRIPAAWSNNTPARLEAALGEFRRRGYLLDYPFGSDLTAQEQALGDCLRALQAGRRQPAQLAALAWRALRQAPPPAAVAPYLERLQLAHAQGLGERVVATLLARLLYERGWLESQS
ncbi:MAG: acetyl-CoA hydrolase/transferase C-terminal domain-containing protein, partial [Parahaliea sp.]